MVWRIPTSPIALTSQITIRLSSDNYIYWRTQVVPILRSNLIYGFIDGTLPCPSEMVPATDKTAEPVSNPLYSAWHQQDQAILSAIVSSLTEPVIGMVMLATTSQETWETLEVSFASQSTARVMDIRGKLNKLRKLDGSATAFFTKVKGMADALAAMGQPLCPEEFNSYLLAGLDGEYDALADRISVRPVTDPMPMRDVYSQLFNAKARIEARRAEMSTDVHHQANYSGRSGGGRPPYPPAQKQGGYTPPPQNSPSGRAPGGNTGGSGSRPICQICSKVSHVASCCFKRFQKNFLGAGNDGRNMERQIAAFDTTSSANATMHTRTASSYPVDPTWYTDTTATDHITSNLDKLTTHEPYRGKE
jgi:hypothetical protein